MTSTLVLRIFAVLTIFFVGIYAAIQKSSSGWPTTLATVQRAAYEQTLLPTAGRAKVYTVIYAYEVNGRTYTGNRSGWASTTSVVQIIKPADERQPRADDIIQISYAPWFPALAVITPGPSPQLWLVCLVAGLFAIIFWVFSHLTKHPIF
jgi:Protein of unknown function (DUF3592)